MSDFQDKLEKTLTKSLEKGLEKGILNVLKKLEKEGKFEEFYIKTALILTISLGAGGCYAIENGLKNALKDIFKDDDIQLLLKELLKTKDK